MRPVARCDIVARMSTHDPFSDDLADDHVAALAAQALTSDEIAIRLGMTADAVRQHASYASAALTDAHDARAARALWERAVGSVTWSESITRLGERVRLERVADPDVAAAKLYLQARKPQQWGSAAQDASPRVYVVALPPVAQDAAAWLAGVEHDRARVIEHAPATGGEAAGGAGVDQE